MKKLVICSDGSLALTDNTSGSKKNVVMCLSKDIKNYQTQYKKKELQKLVKTSNITNYRSQLFK